MASKRRKAAAAARDVPGAEGSCLKSPARRSSRRRGAAGPARDAESPGIKSKTKGETPGEPPVSPRLPEETCSYKTPTRRLASRSHLPTFSSPVNENDAQQEIFWDPQSPITHRLGNERRKNAGNGHTVEISEIVSRIAPQDDKPACYEGNLLGLWIGDDAIPCTPGITKVRSRTKVNGARGLRLKNREEELMKLAKQFDQNLTDAIQDQDASCRHIGHVAPEMSIEHEGVPGENQEQLLGEHLQTNTAMACGGVEGSSGMLGMSENTHQEPVDLDAELALNELFDGPTQPCSDSLSQGLSEDSSNSGFPEKQSLLLQEERASGDVASAAGAGTRDPLQGQGSTSAPTAIPAEKAAAASEQPAPGIVLATSEPAVLHDLEGIAADDFDDWGDDSFLMQITQNPELVGAPDNSCDCAEIQGRTRDPKKLGTVGGGLWNPSEKIPAAHILQKQSTATGKANGVPLEFEKASVSKYSPNQISGCNPVVAQPQSKSVHRDFTRLKCPASSSSSDQRSLPTSPHPHLPKAQLGKHGSNKDNLRCLLSSSSASTALPDLKSTPGPGNSGRLKPKEAPKKSVFLVDDWNKPKFSDDVLDFFCESDNLWGTKRDDDDDLLYQVCDAVEKNTLSQQAVEKEREAKWAANPPSKPQVGPCPAASNQGLSDGPQARKTHLGRKTFSLDAPAAVATVLKKEHPSHPVANQPSKGESIRSVPGKWCRSHSVPEGDVSSRMGSPVLSNGHLNVNDPKWPNGLCNVNYIQSGSLINQTAAVKSNFVFRRTGQPQALALDHEKVGLGRLPGTHQGVLENKNAGNVPVQTSVQANAKPPFKRHLSDSIAQPEAEQRSRKCSQEEIARKKQEALERRKWKMKALLKNTAPT